MKNNGGMALFCLVTRCIVLYIHTPASIHETTLFMRDFLKCYNFHNLTRQADRLCVVRYYFTMRSSLKLFQIISFSFAHNFMHEIQNAFMQIMELDNHDITT